METSTVHAGGRPTKYQASYAKLAFNYALLGVTDKQLAVFFEVNETTIHLWKKEHPQFSKSIRAAKEQADAEIVKSLYQRAKGYAHPDTDIRVVQGEIVKTRLTKHYPPDTQAIQYWLNNRQPQRFRTKTDTDITSKGNQIMAPASPETAAEFSEYLKTKTQD